MSDLRDAADIIAKFATTMQKPVEQVDVVLCEGGDGLGFYAWTPQDDCAFAYIDLPMRLESEEALLHQEWSQALSNLLPVHVIVRPHD